MKAKFLQKKGHHPQGRQKAQSSACDHQEQRRAARWNGRRSDPSSFSSGSPLLASESEDEKEEVFASQQR